MRLEAESVSVTEGQTVSAGRLDLQCTTVTPETVTFRGSLR